MRLRAYWLQNPFWGLKEFTSRAPGRGLVRESPSQEAASRARTYARIVSFFRVRGRSLRARAPVCAYCSQDGPRRYKNGHPRARAHMCAYLCINCPNVSGILARAHTHARDASAKTQRDLKRTFLFTYISAQNARTGDGCQNLLPRASAHLRADYSTNWQNSGCALWPGRSAN